MMNFNICILLIIGILICDVVSDDQQHRKKSCSSCGIECRSACGSRHFRSCCFNYLRKRSVEAMPRDTDLNMENVPSKKSYQYPAITMEEDKKKPDLLNFLEVYTLKKLFYNLYHKDQLPPRSKVIYEEI